MYVQPYLNFEGRAEEAAEFYRTNLGAEIKTLLRFKDSPEPPAVGSVPPGTENNVLHMCLRIGDTDIMGSDCGAQGETKFQGFSLAITVPTTQEADRVFKALTQGGQVQQPLTKTFFSPSFGVVTDRFGISWMIVAEAEAAIGKAS